MDGSGIGVSIQRKEAMDKVTGAAKYNTDFIAPGLLHAKLLTSPFAHAKIIAIDITTALKSSGVLAILTGDDFDFLTGSIIEDRPPLAKGKVRYYGEPVAVVVAYSEVEAAKAVNLIKVEYQPLLSVNSPSDAVKSGVPLVHENLTRYRIVQPAHPVPNSNIAGTVKIRKGDMQKGWQESEVIVEANFSLPQADHAAMETRSVRAEILPDGQVAIHTSHQAPFKVRQVLSRHFRIDPGKITVITPLVGGAFGGKSPVQLEFIAFAASQAVNGRMVTLTNAREEDIKVSPGKIGLDAKVKLGCTRGGQN